MDSNENFNICKNFIKNLVKGKQSVKPADVIYIFQKILTAKAPELYVSYLVQISILLINKSHFTDVAVVLRESIKLSTGTTMEYFKCIFHLIRKIIAAMVNNERHLKRKMIRNFLPVINDILWRVRMTPDLRLHAICHLIWALRSVMKMKVNKSCVAQFLMGDFLTCLKLCTCQADLIAPQLALLRKVVSLLTRVLIPRGGATSIQELMIIAFNSSIEIKWITWMAVCRGFIRNVKGYKRGWILRKEEIFFLKLLKFSIDLERERHKLLPAFQSEIVKFSREFKLIYSLPKNENIKYPSPLRKLKSCGKSQCVLRINCYQQLVTTERNAVDEVGEEKRVTRPFIIKSSLSSGSNYENVVYNIKYTSDEGPAISGKTSSPVGSNASAYSMDTADDNSDHELNMDVS